MSFLQRLRDGSFLVKGNKLHSSALFPADTIRGLKCIGYDKRPQSLARESLDSLDEIVGNKYQLVMF